MKSKLFSLDLADMLKGFFVAVTTAVLTAIMNIINAGGDIFGIDWKMVLGTAVTAGLAYILKNLMTNNKDQILTKDK